MINVAMHGCSGSMGGVISNLISDMEDITIVAGIDRMNTKRQDYPVFPSLTMVEQMVDVIIDFSSAEAVDGLLDYCEQTKIPVVLCTTGLSEAQVKRVAQLSLQSAVLRSANLSLGINMLCKILEESAKTLLQADFDIEIIEKHHNQKIDAPSGTALLLADTINASLEEPYDYIYDRSKERKKREKREIGIQAIRGGSIVGEHEVIFAGKDEVITFSHTAYSKAVFAKGAIQGAKFLAGKTKGLYTMADVIQ